MNIIDHVCCSKEHRGHLQTAVQSQGGKLASASWDAVAAGHHLFLDQASFGHLAIRIQSTVYTHFAQVEVDAAYTSIKSVCVQQAFLPKFENEMEDSKVAAEIVQEATVR